VRKNYGAAYALPFGVWITLFFVVPIAVIFVYSFLARGVYGGVTAHFSLDAYRELCNEALVRTAFTTLCLAAVAALLTLLLALPAAYYLARSRFRNTLLLLVIIPFWTNFLIRIYAWIAILGNNGFLNHLLESTGLLHGYTGFLYNKYAVIVVLMYTYLPYAILPLYTAIEKFDFSLLEAAQDLGATRTQAVFRVLLPNIKAGIVTAVLFTFIPAFGQYAVPQLVGGRDSFMLGTVIARELTVTRNWPLASAIAAALTVVTTLSVLAFMRLNRNTGAHVTEEVAV
jgi:spermidine/putrescine transport system permease protein